MLLAADIAVFFAWFEQVYVVLSMQSWVHAQLCNGTINYMYYICCHKHLKVCWLKTWTKKLEKIKGSYWGYLGVFTEITLNWGRLNW